MSGTDTYHNYTNIFSLVPTALGLEVNDSIFFLNLFLFSCFMWCNNAKFNFHIFGFVVIIKGLICLMCLFIYSAVVSVSSSSPASDMAI